MMYVKPTYRVFDNVPQYHSKWDTQYSYGVELNRAASMPQEIAEFLDGRGVWHVGSFIHFDSPAERLEFILRFL